MCSHSHLCSHSHTVLYFNPLFMPSALSPVSFPFHLSSYILFLYWLAGCPDSSIVFILRYHWCAAWGKVSKVWPAKPQLFFFYLHVVLGAVSDYKWATYVHDQNTKLYQSMAPRIQTGLIKLQVSDTVWGSTPEGKLFAECNCECAWHSQYNVVPSCLIKQNSWSDINYFLSLQLFNKDPTVRIKPH